MTRYQATAAIQVDVGHRVFIVHRGNALPAGVSPTVVKRLRGLGLISKIEEPAKPDSEPTTAAEEPAKPEK